ncbi:hypothetical protein BHM03_00044049 [Ensete ventricosum]|nr:hypothetical protein BHM03_00044049 [Ensete ventricosum]
MYWSAKLPVRGPLATGRYHQNRLSIVNFGYWRSISTVGGRLREKSTIDSRLREKKGRRRRGKKEEEEEKKNTSHRPLLHTVAACGTPVSHRHPRVAQILIIILLVYRVYFSFCTDQAVYGTLFEAEHRSTFYIPYWNLPFARWIVPRQRKFHNDLKIINDCLDGLIKNAKETRQEADVEKLQQRDYSSLKVKSMQDISLLRFLVDMRGVDVDDHQVNSARLISCIFSVSAGCYTSISRQFYTSYSVKYFCNVCL